MTKQDFLTRLRKGLSGLPQADIDERLTFYSEMIDDRMEEGLSEEEAVAAVGWIDEIISQIIVDTPPENKDSKKRRLKGWEITLLVLGSPIWVSLLIAAAAVTFSVYICLWSVIVSLWAVFGSLLISGFCGFLAGIGFAFGGKQLTGIAIAGAGMLFVGLSIFLHFGCKAATKGILLFTRKIALWMKKRFTGKEHR